MIDSVVVFKWHTPGYRSKFTAEHVHTMRDMVRRHYPKPHRFICITDDPAGIDPSIEVFPLWDDYKDLPNPTWGKAGPSCYRRLKTFALEFKRIAGKRFVCIDLDMVIVGDLQPLWDRDEDFVMWEDPAGVWPYNGSMFMMNAGCRSQVWTDFDPVESPKAAAELGYRGSDQAWISYKLGPGEATWKKSDGVIRYRESLTEQDVSRHRIISFCGPTDPWNAPDAWIRRHYRRDDQRRTIHDLVGAHQGKRIVVMGGAPELAKDIEGLKADIWISANEHGARLRKVDYCVAMDPNHCVDRDRMDERLHAVSDAPIISGEDYADYLLIDYPFAPDRVLSGIMGAYVAWLMGGHPTILAGFSGMSLKVAKKMAPFIFGEIRVVGDRLAEVWPAYKPKEKFRPFAEHAAVRKFLGIQEGVRIRVLKPTHIRGRDVMPDQEMVVMRREVARLLKHQVVEEVYGA